MTSARPRTSKSKMEENQRNITQSIMNHIYTFSNLEYFSHLDSKHRYLKSFFSTSWRLLHVIQVLDTSCKSRLSRKID
uniref:Uncharacterized protein n=1 Tax=Nelumbo nucifera TaxID=4432 RepID=A0A822YHA4_NELNU|nr:TPA_asm: hypothetical protein HUJ06_010821 [Nelumbo nucifera]